MRFTGKLKTWDDGRGFGFITPSEGGQDIFVHISELPRGRVPIEGDVLSFEVALNPQGKKKAVKVRPMGVPAVTKAGDTRARARRRPAPARSMFSRVVLVAMLGLAGWWGYQHYGSRAASMAEPSAAMERKTLFKSAPSPSFSCDGRRYCSQMTSCAEATYFLKNCPGVQMDGNGDGVPCEKQWCTGILKGLLQ